MDTAGHERSWVRTLTPTHTTYMHKAIYRHRTKVCVCEFYSWDDSWSGCLVSNDAPDLNIFRKQL